MKQLALFFVISYCWIICPGIAQSLRNSSPETKPAICVGDTVVVLKNPGKVNSVVDTIFFGEELSWIGEPILVAQTEQTFVQIETDDSTRGWVEESNLVKEGFLAVVLAPIRLYRRPNTPSTATTQEFAFGEQVVVANQIGMWGELLSKNRRKAGWVKELNFISTHPIDFEIVALISEPQSRSDDHEKDRWSELLRRAEDEKAELFDLFQSFYETKFPGESIPRRRVSARSIPIAPQEKTTRPEPLIGIETKEFIDPVSQKRLTQIEEFGPFRIVRMAPPKGAVVEVAHRSLERGKKILLELPENEGFVEAVVVKRLDPNSQYVLGMSQKMANLFFGEKKLETIHLYYLKE